MGAGQARLVPQEIPRCMRAGASCDTRLPVHFQCHLNHGYSVNPMPAPGSASPRSRAVLLGMRPGSSASRRVQARSPCRAMLAASRGSNARRPARPPRSAPSSMRHRTTRRSWPRRIHRSLAKLVLAPARRRTRLGHMHGGDQLVLAQSGGIGAPACSPAPAACGPRPPAISSVAPRPTMVSTQSAAGSACARLPPSVPRLRMAR